MTQYEGGCHCGKVRFSVELELENLMTCNCSICGKTGTILAFVPKDKFEQTAGADALTDYQFNSRSIHHLFCSTCGIRSFAHGTTPDGKESVAINVRCLDGVDVHTLNVATKFEGRSL
ncbi:MAG TPA: GFA family protein [Polyangiaceae bacterium]|nr:GFA family protein [Polyangiaceae bacterium]